MDQGDNKNKNRLHQTLRASSSINKKKNIKVSKLSSEERIILHELDLWKVKVHQLNQAKRYMQKGEQVELKERIQNWRSACQNIAMALVPIVLQDQQRQQPSALLSWGYDEGYERELSSLEEQDHTHDDVDIDLCQGVQKRQRQQFKENDQETENDDDNDNDMILLLSRLRIDPQLIHYSIEKEEFYD